MGHVCAKMCECVMSVNALQRLTGGPPQPNTQLSAVVVYRILTLMLNSGLLSQYCGILQAVTVISLGE